jgi:hypothetical protein
MHAGLHSMNMQYIMNDYYPPQIDPEHDLHWLQLQATAGMPAVTAQRQQQHLLPRPAAGPQQLLRLWRSACHAVLPLHYPTAQWRQTSDLLRTRQCALAHHGQLLRLQQQQLLLLLLVLVLVLLLLVLLLLPGGVVGYDLSQCCIFQGHDSAKTYSLHGDPSSGT